MFETVLEACTVDHTRGMVYWTFPPTSPKKNCSHVAKTVHKDTMCLWHYVRHVPIIVHDQCQT